MKKLNKIMLTSLCATALIGGVTATSTIVAYAADEVEEVAVVEEMTETGETSGEITTPEIPIDPAVIPENGGTETGGETDGTETGGETTAPEVPINPPVIPETGGTGNETGGGAGETTPGVENPVTPQTGSGITEESSTSTGNTTAPNKQNPTQISISKGSTSETTVQSDGQESTASTEQTEENQLPKTGKTKVFDFIMLSISAFVGNIGMVFMYLKRYLKKS